jgi:hypothetical protein
MWGIFNETTREWSRIWTETCSSLFYFEIFVVLTTRLSQITKIIKLKHSHSVKKANVGGTSRQEKKAQALSHYSISCLKQSKVTVRIALVIWDRPLFFSASHFQTLNCLYKYSWWHHFSWLWIVLIMNFSVFRQWSLNTSSWEWDCLHSGCCY